MGLDVNLGEGLFTANITHNLGEMADAAGIYKAIWRPEEIGIKTTKQLIPVLEKGIVELESRPDYYEQFNAPNGFGTYKDFLPWLKEYLAACYLYPSAKIEVSR